MISFWIVLFIVLLTAFGLCFAYDLSKVGGRSFAAIKHLLREYFWSKNSILYYAVIALLGIAIFNHRLWTGEILLNWWRKGYGSIGDQTFFPVEEWLALHSHNNEWPVFVGYVTVIIVIIVLHSLSRKIRIHGFGHALFIFALIACFLGTMPCLCRTKERMHRQFCPYNLKAYQQEFEKEIASRHVYPALLPDIESRFRTKIQYFYPGANRKSSAERFIVIEDAPRTHAGDLRHRLWSDETIDFYYPWKSEGGGK